MSEICKTVLIEGGKDGPVRINESDYDEKVHTLYKPKKAEAEQIQKAEDQRETAHPASKDPNVPETLAPSAIQPNAPQYLVTTEGKGKAAKSFVVHPDGRKVENTVGVNADGYATEKDAWDAILNLQPKPAGNNIQMPPLMLNNSL